MEFLSVIIDTWNLIIIQPMINGLVLLYSWSFLNFGIAIVAFTLLVRLALVHMDWTLPGHHPDRSLQSRKPRWAVEAPLCMAAQRP